MSLDILLTFILVSFFTVVRNLTVDCILGVDCLMQHETVIDLCCVTMGGVEFPFYAQPVQNNRRDCTLQIINNVVKVAQTVVIAGRTVQLLEVMLPLRLQAWECVMF